MDQPDVGSDRRAVIRGGHTGQCHRGQAGDYRKHHYVKHKARKSLSMGQHVDRNQQFENIARLKREYMGTDNPIVSIDTKKKELVGTFYREGKLLRAGVDRLRPITTSPAPPRGW